MSAMPIIWARVNDSVIRPRIVSVGIIAAVRVVAVIIGIRLPDRDANTDAYRYARISTRCRCQCKAAHHQRDQKKLFPIHAFPPDYLTLFESQGFANYSDFDSLNLG